MANLYQNKKTTDVGVVSAEGASLRVGPGLCVRGAMFSEYTDLTYVEVSDETAALNGLSPVYTAPTAAQADSITAGSITDTEIVSTGISKLAALSVVTGSIAAKAVTAAKIADVTITAAQIAAKTITDAQITDTGISKIAANAVTDAALPAAGITAIMIDPTSSGCTITTSAAGLKITVP